MEEKENEVLEKNEEVKEKKGKNILKYFLFVILIGCLCAGCFFLGTTFTSSNDDKKDGKDKVTEETNEKEEDVQIEQLTKDSVVVKKLFEVFREDKNCLVTSLWALDSEEAAKKFIAYKNIDSSDIKDVKCGDLDDSFDGMHYCAMNDEAAKYYGIDEKKYELAIKNETTKGFSEEVFEKKYKEFFGKDSILNHDDFTIGEGPIAHYDKNNKLYAEYSCQCGGMCGGSSQTLDSITQNGLSLILNTTIDYYEDTTDKQSIIYTFEYEKETGNYIFESRVKK